MTEFQKDPSATLDYFIDWSNWLEDDTIVTSTWDVPDDLENVLDEEVDGRCTVWLSGGEVGKSYTVTNHIVTNSTPPRQDDRSLYIYVMEL